MQDKKFHQSTFFGRHKSIEMWYTTWNKLQTHKWHPFSRHNWQYVWLLKTFSILLFTRPVIFPVHNMFYPPQWWVNKSLH